MGLLINLRANNKPIPITAEATLIIIKIIEKILRLFNFNEKILLNFEH